MPSISSNEFIKNLKKHAQKPYFYFYGEESFLIQEIVKKLTKEVVGKPNDFNSSWFYADDGDVAEIIASAGTLPFGSQHRLVVVRRADSLSAQDQEQFLSYLENPCESTCLVFWGGEKVDSRRKFFKKMSQEGLLVQAERLKGPDVYKWIHHLAKKRGHALDSQAAALIEMLVGNSLHGLDQALERISLYLGDEKTINAEIVRQTLADTHEGILWNLTDALGKRDFSQAFLALKRILHQKEISSPVLIVATISSFFRRLLWIRTALELGFSDDKIVQSTRLSPGALYFNKSIATRFSIAELEDALRQSFEADRTLKSSGLCPQLVLEDLLLQILPVDRSGAVCRLSGSRIQG